MMGWTNEYLDAEQQQPSSHNGNRSSSQDSQLFERVREILRRDGIRQKILAEQLGMTGSTLSLILQSKYKHTKQRHVYRLAKWVRDQDQLFAASVKTACASSDYDMKSLATQLKISEEQWMAWKDFSLPPIQRNDIDMALKHILGIKNARALNTRGSTKRKRRRRNDSNNLLEGTGATNNQLLNMNPLLYQLLMTQQTQNMLNNMNIGNMANNNKMNNLMKMQNLQNLRKLQSLLGNQSPLTSPNLISPNLISPNLTSPNLPSPNLSSPSLSSAQTSPLTSPNPADSAKGLSRNPFKAIANMPANHNLPSPSVSSPGIGASSLSTPTMTSMTSPSLTSPNVTANTMAMGNNPFRAAMANLNNLTHLAQLPDLSKVTNLANLATIKSNIQQNLQNIHDVTNMVNHAVNAGMNSGGVNNMRMMTNAMNGTINHSGKEATVVKQQPNGTNIQALGANGVATVVKQQPMNQQQISQQQMAQQQMAQQQMAQQQMAQQMAQQHMAQRHMAQQQMNQQMNQQMQLSHLMSLAGSNPNNVINTGQLNMLQQMNGVQNTPTQQQMIANPLLASLKFRNVTFARNNPNNNNNRNVNGNNSSHNRSYPSMAAMKIPSYGAASQISSQMGSSMVSSSSSLSQAAKNSAINQLQNTGNTLSMNQLQNNNTLDQLQSMLQSMSHQAPSQDTTQPGVAEATYTPSSSSVDPTDTASLDQIPNFAGLVGESANKKHKF